VAASAEPTEKKAHINTPKPTLANSFLIFEMVALPFHGQHKSNHQGLINQCESGWASPFAAPRSQMFTAVQKCHEPLNLARCESIIARSKQPNPWVYICLFAGKKIPNSSRVIK
jgi:hypothetical protein